MVRFILKIDLKKSLFLGQTVKKTSADAAEFSADSAEPSVRSLLMPRKVSQKPMVIRAITTEEQSQGPIYVTVSPNIGHYEADKQYQYVPCMTLSMVLRVPWMIRVYEALCRPNRGHYKAD